MKKDCKGYRSITPWKVDL